VGGGINFCGAAATYLGLLASTFGDIAAAERHFEDAIALNERAGAWAHVVNAQYAYARLLLREADPAARDRGSRLLDDALRGAEKLELLGLVAKSRQLREQAGRAEAPAMPAAPIVLSELTRRESEVLTLIAAGKTNQEIAEALVISPNTAAHHVASIIAKLGLPNRTAVAAYALSRGLNRTDL
jgi:DNA-binding CsgD family transcriptional regulator